MNKLILLARSFPPVALVQNRTPMMVMLVIFFLGHVRSLNAQNPPRGDAIGGGPIVSANPAGAVTVQTNANPAALVCTNAAGECVVGFDVLTSFPMQVPDSLLDNTNQAWADAQVNGMIPASIKSFDGKKVRIEGFMMPTTWDKEGKVSDFLLLANQITCCYGGPTQIHEFITVHVKGKPVNSNMETTIPVGGILHVGAARANGQLVGIYRLETETFAVPSSN